MEEILGQRQLKLFSQGIHKPTDLLSTLSHSEDLVEMTRV